MVKLLSKVFSIQNDYSSGYKRKIIKLFGIKFSHNFNKNTIKNKSVNINFKTFSDMATTIKKNITILPKDIDLVVGIPRSGIVPAYMIALFLNKKVCSLNELMNNLSPMSGERPLENRCDQRILIIDDSIYQGTALSKVKTLINSCNHLKDKQISYCTIYAREESKHLVDYYMDIVESPRIFQWNYLNHCIAKDSCFDLDGVLCVDPTPEQNDDGPKYIEFILSAKPLYIPQYEIHSIVTSRLEKYRPQTEEWLAKNNIQYKNLFMLNLPTAEERRRTGAHIPFKVNVYKKLKDTILFIESEEWQAKEIATLSEKPSICVTTDTYFN